MAAGKPSLANWECGSGTQRWSKMIQYGHSFQLKSREEPWVKDLKNEIGGNAMKKLPRHNEIMKDYVRCPIFWGVVQENGHFLHIRNWLTGEHRVCRK